MTTPKVAEITAPQGAEVSVNIGEVKSSGEVSSSVNRQPIIKTTIKTWIALVAAFVALCGGGGAGWAIGAKTGGRHSMATMEGVSAGHHGMMAMEQKVFLSMMVAHHQMALDMAEAVVKAGKDPRVKALAQRVITAQKREIDQMRAMYRALYGADIPEYHGHHTGDPMAGMMGMAGMTSDAVSGAADPDQAFLRMMIPHHAGALLMADMVLNGKDVNEEVKKLAESIIADQSGEIAEMQGMRKVS